MMDKKSDSEFFVAVVGSGYWGKNLVRNYNAIGVLKVICDSNGATLETFKAQYPDIETCDRFKDILGREDIQGIVIATPAETHFEIARQALDAGKHVYVEKPLVLEESQAEELIALADEKHLILMVGHLLQYHPVFIKLRELAFNGELGRINYIYSHRLNLGKIRRQENILWSFAPHDISMILSLAGEQPESISATGGNYLHQKIADVTTTHIDFPSGRKAHIFVSWLHPFKEQKLVVVGDRKMAVFDDTLPWDEKLLLYPHQINWKDNMPVPTRAEPEKVKIPEAEPLRQECEHFLKCMETGETPRTDGREGLRVLKVLNAAQRSLNENADRVYPQLCLDAENRGADPRRDPRLRRSDKEYSVHSTAIIDKNVTIEEGTKIWHFSHILSDSKIGRNCNIGQNVVIGPDVCVGDECKIQNNVSIYKGVTLEDGVFCGPSMVFTNVYNPRAQIRKMDQVRSTFVKKGTTIGANATILCGITIGKYAFIGAGALINKDVPDYALIVGNPGRVIGWVCQCGERLDGNLLCGSCGKRYKRKDGGSVSILMP